MAAPCLQPVLFRHRWVPVLDDLLWAGSIVSGFILGKMREFDLPMIP
jgi:hypothetical protein